MRITCEFPIAMDPEKAADKAWEATEREMIRVQARETEPAPAAATS